MDELPQKIEFLDLTDIDEHELNHLQQVLYTISPSVKLPWEVHTDYQDATEYGSSAFAVAPLAHPTLRGVFLPQPLYSAAPVGLIPSVTAAEPPNGPSAVGLVPSMDGSLECNSSLHPHHMTAEAVYQENVPQVPVMSVPPPVSVPPPAQPVMTTIYNMIPAMPLSNVYVGNMTANVNVQSYVGTHLTSYPQQPPVYRAPNDEMASPNATRGNMRPRGRGTKAGGKRVDGNQYVNSRNVHEVVMESPPSNGPPLQPANYHIYPVAPPIPYQQTYYPSPQHPSAQHAAGPPIYLQNLYSHHPQQIYGTFHQPHLYSNAAIPAATVPSTEPSPVVPGYTVEDMPIEEEKEVPVASYPTEDLNGNEEVKNTLDIEPESCDVVGSVVVNNSNMLVNSVQQPPVRTEPVNSQYTPEESVTSAEIVEDSVPNSINAEPETSVPIVEIKRESTPDKCQKVESVAPVVKQAPGVQSSPFPSTQKNSPFQRQPSTPVEVNTTVTPTQTSLDGGKSWASLFNKNGNVGSPSLFDARIPTVQKPVATVPPFPNSATVVPSFSDATRKTLDSAAVPSSPSVSETSKNFPPLSHSQLPSSAVDDPNLYRLGEFLSKYQLDHKAISLQPRGLTNRSNWCYINSTLQALLACPPFYNLMKNLPLPARRTGKSPTPIIDSICQFVDEFVPLSATSRVNRKEKAQRKDENFEVQAGAAFEPSYIYKMLSNIQSDTFKVEGRQEDAEEFLSCLLNAINDEMLELIKLVEDPSSKSNLSNGDLANGDAASQSQDEEEEEDGWKVIGPKNKGSITRRADFGRTPVSDIFRGELRSRVHRAGDESTDSVQPFFTLQLDIEKAQSVKDALELLVGRDQLEGVTCSKTNQEVEAWQQVTLQELPLVLILHLKWFDYKLDGCSKIVKTVEFPIDLSVDAKLMSSTKNYNRNQKKYKLFAVVYHDGKEATKGHYITDVYHVGYGGWVRYDDSVVKPVQESNMLHPRGSRVPYLLYYRRLDTIGSGAMTPDKSR